ncbi:19395_t:CDS:2, partial [Cetraspora pellucida]
MITPNDRVNENEEYKKNFYVAGENLFCIFCKCILNYKNKFLLDQHLKTNKHRTNEYKPKENLQETTSQNVSNICQEEREMINVDLVYALTQANIPLEKIDKLKPFLLKYCKNGSI